MEKKYFGMKQGMEYALAVDTGCGHKQSRWYTAEKQNEFYNQVMQYVMTIGKQSFASLSIISRPIQAEADKRFI